MSDTSGMRVQLFSGDRPLFPDWHFPAVKQPENVPEAVILRVVTGHFGGSVWSLDIEVDSWNGLPRIVKVTTADNVTPEDEG